jgi:hypothetical protein
MHSQLDNYLQKEFTHEATKKCQEVIRYVKQCTDKIMKYNRYSDSNIYEEDHNNLPFLDYVDFAVYATNAIGKEAASYFIEYYTGSTWYRHNYSPNVYIDIVKLKKFAKDYDLEYKGLDELDDVEYIKKDRSIKFGYPDSMIKETVCHPENFHNEEITQMIPVLKKLMPFLKKLIPEIVEQLAPNIVAEITKQLAPNIVAEITKQLAPNIATEITKQILPDLKNLINTNSAGPLSAEDVSTVGDKNN